VLAGNVGALYIAPDQDGVRIAVAPRPWPSHRCSPVALWSQCSSFFWRMNPSAICVVSAACSRVTMSPICIGWRPTYGAEHDSENCTRCGEKRAANLSASTQTWRCCKRLGLNSAMQIGQRAGILGSPSLFRRPRPERLRRQNRSSGNIKAKPPTLPDLKDPHGRGGYQGGAGLAQVLAQSRTFYDSSGTVSGRSITNGSGWTTFYDASGRAGRSTTSGNQTTIYGSDGRRVGTVTTTKPQDR
jgi:hypothetical protein